MHHFHARELPPSDVARRELADAARKLRPFQITNAHDVSRLELPLGVGDAGEQQTLAGLAQGFSGAGIHH